MTNGNGRMKQVATALDERIDALFPAYLEVLRESLRIPSVKGEPREGAPFGVEVRAALDHALGAAASLGFRTVDVDGMIGYAEYGEGEEMVAVIGHLDVVPEGTGWTVPPFEGVVRDGFLYGRGTGDDKGPIFGALFGLAAIRDLKIPLKRRIRVLFGCDEESGFADVAHYVTKEELPVLGFTPDAEFPLVNAEKGGMNMELLRTFHGDGAIRLLSFLGGSAPNVVPDRAEARLLVPSSEARDILATLTAEASAKGWSLESGTEPATEPDTTVLFLRTRGIAAHGSTPEKGENAVARLLLLLTALPGDGEVARCARDFAAVLGEETDGTSLGVPLEDAVSGKLTVNLGMALWTARGERAGEGVLDLTLNVRHPVTFTADDVVPALRASVERAGFVLENVRGKAAVHFPVESELVRKLQQAYTSKTGLDATPRSMGGGTYAKGLPNVVAFGTRFLDEPELAHQADERISLDRMRLAMKILAEAMVLLAQ